MHGSIPYAFPTVNGVDLGAFQFKDVPDGNDGVVRRNFNRRAQRGYMSEAWHLAFNSAGGATIVQAEAQICGGTYNAAHNTVEGGTDLKEGWAPFEVMQNDFSGGGHNMGAQTPEQAAAMFAVIGPDEKPTHHHP